MLSNPNYFNILCIAWGSLALLYAFVNLFLGAKASAWSLKAFAPEKRPAWLVVVSVLYLLLLAFTWYAVATFGIAGSWIVATLFSLGIFKTFLILFKYERYCGLVRYFYSKPSTIALVTIFITIFSALLVFMGLFYYR